MKPGRAVAGDHSGEHAQLAVNTGCPASNPSHHEPD